MQKPGARSWWKQELGSFLRFGVFLLLVAVMLLWPGEKAPGFRLAAFAAVAVVTGFLVWGVYRRYRAEGSGGGKPSEHPGTME